MADAIRTTYTVPVTLADGSKVDIAGLQVYMLANENLYVLTFRTDQPDKYSETFDQVIATFRRLDSAPASASLGGACSLRSAIGSRRARRRASPPS